MKRPSVLVVTGAYYPEISGGGLQARTLIRALGDQVEFAVLTTSSVATETTQVDGVPVHRIAVDLGSAVSQWRGLAGFLLVLLQRSVDVVHLQGFSRKNILVTAAARLRGKKVVLTLQTGVHDDASVVKAHTTFGLWSFMHADAVIAVSQALRAAAERAGVAVERLQWIPNGVDTTRFRPAAAGERAAIRQRLSLPADKTIILFVGFFSREKGPHRLFAAWKQLPDGLRNRTVLLFIGQTTLPHTEVDPALVDEIRRDAQDITPQPLFVEQTLEIELYYQAADLFVLPSTREGCPNVLLEAMSAGLPAISTRLPGSTDSIVTDRGNGRLVPPEDLQALRNALQDMLSNPEEAVAYGAAARKTACEQFSLDRTAEAYLQTYRALAAL